MPYLGTITTMESRLTYRRNPRSEIPAQKSPLRTLVIRGIFVTMTHSLESHFSPRDVVLRAAC